MPVVAAAVLTVAAAAVALSSSPPRCHRPFQSIRGRRRRLSTSSPPSPSSTAAAAATLAPPTNLICQSGPTAACLHLVLLCGRVESEAAALAASGGRRHRPQHFHTAHKQVETARLRPAAPHFHLISPFSRRFLRRSAPVLSGLRVFGNDRALIAHSTKLASACALRTPDYSGHPIHDGLRDEAQPPEVGISEFCGGGPRAGADSGSGTRWRT
ncbi:hypothetical protein Zmor_027740 [Zophobas morio]|uniref:Secreted protein n=1 Tax=Zophobas morio TaxID=2755281 RepID=A0AA38M2C5_9CUCU|nr:hypothetical protein Zmor_027740 [Zophobas morio]